MFNIKILKSKYKQNLPQSQFITRSLLHKKKHPSRGMPLSNRLLKSSHRLINAQPHNTICKNSIRVDYQIPSPDIDVYRAHKHGSSYQALIST